MARRSFIVSIVSLVAVSGAALVVVMTRAADSQAPSALSVRGRIEAGGDVLSLGASTTGTISQLLVKAGDHVQAGQALLNVECRDLESEISARQADLAAADAVLARVTHGPRPEEIEIGEANVNLATARLHEAQKAFDRTQALHEGVTVTRAQIDQTERDARIASAMLEEARAKLVLLKAGSRTEELAEAHAQRDARQARLDAAAARFSYCTVAAPVGGVVLRTSVSPGQLISFMAPMTLITMADDSRRRVRAFVAEADISRICRGERADMTVEGVAGPFEGRIDDVAPDLGAAPRESAPPGFRAVSLSFLGDEQRPAIGRSVTVKLAGCSS